MKTKLLTLLTGAAIIGFDFQHRPAGVIFRCDQHDAVALALVFLPQGFGYRRVLFPYGRHFASCQSF